MAQYVFCVSKSNKPRMDVRVCLKKCADSDTCPELQAALETAAKSEDGTGGDNTSGEAIAA